MAETYLIIYKKMINDHFGEFPPLHPPKRGEKREISRFFELFEFWSPNRKYMHFFYLLILSLNNMSKKFQNKIGRFR